MDTIIPPDAIPLKCCSSCPEGQQWHPATLAYFQACKSSKDGLQWLCKECTSKRRKAYRKCPEVHEKEQAYKKEYRSRPEAKKNIQDYNKEYASRPDVKERRRARRKNYHNKLEIRNHGISGSGYRQRKNERRRFQYNNDPEVRKKILAQNKAYRDRPEARELKRAYYHRPEVKARYHAQQKVYYSRPGIREQRILYARNRYSNPETRKQIHAQQKEYNRRSEVLERERIRSKERRSCPKTREYLRTHAMNRRARLKTIPGTHTMQQIREMLQRHRWRCYYCRAKLQRNHKATYGYNFHIDHTFPMSRTSGDAPVNDISYLVPACPTCNMRKNNKYPWEFPEGGRLL